MEENRASITAIVTAYSRVYHSMYDDPKIFDDFLAVQLFSKEELGFLEKNLADSLNFIAPEIASECLDQAAALKHVMRHNSPTTLSRSRYTEDILEDCIRMGVKQYVILGAGMDTFAFRRPDLAEKIKVFEIDHPATQANKMERIKNAGWELPSHLHYIPVDFSKTGLAEALESSEYNLEELTFFSWLGVTYYLPYDAVMDTFRAITRSSLSSSTVVFDYIDKDALLPGKASERSKLTQEIVKRAGEPMKSGFDPSSISGELEKTGLILKETIHPEEIEKRYFEGRNDGYHSSDHISFAWTEIK